MEDLMLHTANKTGITFTPSALAEAKRLLSAGGKENQGVRLSVKGGGCAGFTYVMEFDEEKPGDTVFTQEGLHVFVDLASLLYLQGTEVDFQTGLNARGFIYHNPNASKTCGCGESFG